MSPSLKQLLSEGQALLADPIDAEFLLIDLLDLQRTTLITRGDEPTDQADADNYRAALQRRLAGEPVAYITGRRGFWNIDLKVTPATLIPRPETELLVEHALLHASSAHDLDVLDLCTGSGAVALALAHERPEWQITGSDLSTDALQVAQYNRDTLALTNVRLVQSDLFAALGDQRFDIITANPPYVADDDPHLKQGDLRYEPTMALASGPQGDTILIALIAQAEHHLNPGGLLLIEHGYDQRERVLELANSTALINIRDVSDHSGQPRVLCAERSAGQD